MGSAVSAQHVGISNRGSGGVVVPALVAVALAAASPLAKASAPIRESGIALAWPPSQLLHTPAASIIINGPRAQLAPVPAPEASGKGGDSSNGPSSVPPQWQRRVPLGTMGQTAECALQRPSKKEGAAWRRDRVAARWAPLRHRCHAWRIVPKTKHRMGNAADIATAKTFDSSTHKDQNQAAIEAFGGASAGEASSLLPSPSPASGTHNESWAYRICFASEATAWTPQPWAERLSFGWYNETLDELHNNGSVTLHYRNGTGNRSATVRCDCSSSGGPPEMVAWETRSGGLVHSLVFSLASCCLFKDAQRKRLPLQEVFGRLISPVLTAPCYAYRYGPWSFRLCFSNMTLSRIVAENLAVAGESAAMGSKASEVGGEGDPKQQQPQPQQEDGLAGHASAAASVAGSPRLSGATANSTAERKQGGLLLGSGTASGPRLVPARRVGHETFEDWGDESTTEEDAAALVAARLAAALAPASRRHQAAELLLERGGSCGTSFHSASVRWICPSSWRTVSPEIDGGHTALLAVERPSRCKWVAWVASMLVCAEKRLLPAPASPVQQIICKIQPKANGELFESSSSSSSRRSGSVSDSDGASAGVAAQASASHSNTDVGSHERPSQPQQQQRGTQKQQEMELGRLQGLLLQSLGRPGGLFEIGQIVENLADGTRAVVMGWDGGPGMDNRLAEAEEMGPRAAATVAAGSSGATVASSPHYLLLLAAGQLPAFGQLTAEIWGDRPGRVAVVPQAYLRLWRGGPRHTSLSSGALAAASTAATTAAAAAPAATPIQLPRGAEGRLFQSYDYTLRRFTPTEELLGQHAASYRDHTGSAGDDMSMDVGASSGGDSTIAAASSDGVEDLDVLLGEMGLTVKSRRAKAAAQLADSLSARRIELQEKLATLKNLQARMQSLQSRATELKQAAAGGESSTEGSSLDEAG